MYTIIRSRWMSLNKFYLKIQNINFYRFKKHYFLKLFQQMIKMVSQQYRYMLVMVIVLLTIFIYVIYSSNEMQVPGRIHTSASVDSFETAEALVFNDLHHNDTGFSNTNRKYINLDEAEKQSKLNYIFIHIKIKIILDLCIY